MERLNARMAKSRTLFPRNSLAVFFARRELKFARSIVCNPTIKEQAGMIWAEMGRLTKITAKSCAVLLNYPLESYDVWSGNVNFRDV